jgi:hypothetical protein
VPCVGRGVTNPLAQLVESQRRAIRHAALRIDGDDGAAKHPGGHHRALRVAFEVHFDTRSRTKRSSALDKRTAWAQIDHDQVVPGADARAQPAAGRAVLSSSLAFPAGSTHGS